MIVFYNEKFKLDFSDVKLKLVEQNSLFYDYMYKKHSMPFTINVDAIISTELGFIDLPNSRGYEVKYDGQLFIENDFEPAKLILKSIKGKKLQGIIYHEANTVYCSKRI
ncbi:hypothetical protein SAMN04489761_3083 [Tenacibaculum sp. MAR_2009_124]|uniref:hypothetical protein n=1 Tax=Tenacibaculum sp. MAR_2009_124 TaxID=1250059 RepID=UPI00089CA34A|nr:hypothetical protein [Tenacibaculum sp. MAR_2009_124]SEC47062.1 hypothetical protein SAMN04489761_3083 [Tenacibaculum sp. MAR_2009_124]